MKRVVLLTDEDLERIVGWHEELERLDDLDEDGRLRFQPDVDETDEELAGRLKAAMLR